jgi:glycosyltransferase involved in cell wall biosynthesis
MNGKPFGKRDTKMPLRVAMVVSHPIQYLCPMYQEIAADGRVTLQVIFAESGAGPRFDEGFGQVVKWQDNILEGYPHSIVETAASARTDGVVEELKKFKPDVLHVNGYHRPYLRGALRWARRSGTAAMITTDSELLHPRPWHARLIKRLALPHIFAGIQQFLTMGDENGRYYEHYGASPDRFLRLSWPIDSRYYDQLLAKRDELRRATRERLGIAQDAVVVLCVGKLIPRKAQAELIRAFVQITGGERRSAVLLLAGSGVDRAKLEELAKPAGPAVQFLGFVGIDKLPEYYMASDVYAHPASMDPHPVAISEALYCSLPIVVSDRVGSRGPTDDVQVGRNGWVFPVGDVVALSEILADLIDHAEKRAEAGKFSRQLGLTHTADHCARQLIEGAERAIRVRDAISH